MAERTQFSYAKTVTCEMSADQNVWEPAFMRLQRPKFRLFRKRTYRRMLSLRSSVVVPARHVRNRPVVLPLEPAIQVADGLEAVRGRFQRRIDIGGLMR